MFSVFKPSYFDQQARTHQEQFHALMDATGFVEINHTLDQLKVQKQKLENECSQTNATMLSRQKNVIISGIYNSVTQTIDYMQNKFQEITEHNEINVLKARYELIGLCIHKVLNILSDDFSNERLQRSVQILNSHRDSVRNFTLYPLHYAMVGTAVVLAGPASLLGAVGLGLVSHLGLRFGENMLGVNAETTSLKLVTSLFMQFINQDKILAERLEKLEPGVAQKITSEIWKDVIEKYTNGQLQIKVGCRK